MRKKTPSAKVKKLRLKLVRSPIGYPQKQRATVLGLGLRRLNSEVIRPDSPEIRGMIAKVSHLLRVESLEE